MRIRAAPAVAIASSLLTAGISQASSGPRTLSCYHVVDEPGDQAVVTLLGDTEGLGIPALDIRSVTIRTTPNASVVTWRLATFQRPAPGSTYKYSLIFRVGQQEYILIIRVGMAGAPAATQMGDGFFLARSGSLAGSESEVPGSVDPSRDQLSATLRPADLSHASFKGVTLLQPFGQTGVVANQVELLSDQVDFSRDLPLISKTSDCA